jgi:hypothetical protein
MRLNRLATSLLFVTAFALVAARPARAATILSFQQTDFNETLNATTNGAGTTTLSTTDMDVSVSLASFFGGGGLHSGFLTFNAVSTSQAVDSSGTITQNYAGTFEIYSGTGLTGTNYLSGTFSDLLTGSGTGTNLVATTAGGDIVVFTSDLGTLVAPLGISLSFISVTPDLHITTEAGLDTVAAFSTNVSGLFQAEGVTSNVPEPASMLLLGTGLLGLGAVYRRRQKARKSAQ